jgi:HEAT repeat protein
VLSNDQDDLVTLFWEEDFRAIQYYAVEELTKEREGPRLQDQLASGSIEGGQGGGAPADAVSLKDIEQPAAYFPVEACRLKEDEIEALRSELAREESSPFWLAVVELAIDLTLLETAKEEQQSLAEALVSIVNRLLMDGDLEAVSKALEHMNGLADMAFQDVEPVRNLNARLVQSLADPERLERFLLQMEGTRSLKPTELTAYIARLGSGALSFLPSWMGRMTTPAHRRAVAEAILAAGEPGMEDLAAHLPPHQEVSDTRFLREALYVLAHTPADRALPLLENLLGASAPVTRRETALVLGRFNEPRVDELCLSLLGDGDPEVRSTALDTLVRRGKGELARPILDYSISAPDFGDRDLAEKRRIFAAVAKLGGAEVLDWFVKLLRLEERRWFASRKDREVREAAVHGIRLVGTDEARQLLHDMASKGDRFVRAACLKELAVERRT